MFPVCEISYNRTRNTLVKRTAIQKMKKLHALKKTRIMLHMLSIKLHTFNTFFFRGDVQQHVRSLRETRRVRLSRHIFRIRRRVALFGSQRRRCRLDEGHLRETFLRSASRRHPGGTDIRKSGRFPILLSRR